MSTAFIAGATGYSGRALVELLREDRVTAVAHVRPDSSRLEEWAGVFDGLGAVVDNAAWEHDALVEALSRHAPEVIFCLIGTTKKRARSDKKGGRDSSYEAVDYGLTRLLVNAAAEACPKARFVYLSSLGVREKTRNAYMKARWKAEECVRASGASFTIVRPSFITGKGRDDARPLERFGGVVFNALLAVTGGLGARKLRQKYRARDNHDLAKRLKHVAWDQQFCGQVVTLDQVISAEVDT